MTTCGFRLLDTSFQNIWRTWTASWCWSTYDEFCNYDDDGKVSGATAQLIGKAPIQQVGKSISSSSQFLRKWKTTNLPTDENNLSLLNEIVRTTICINVFMLSGNTKGHWLDELPKATKCLTEKCFLATRSGAKSDSYPLAPPPPPSRLDTACIIGESHEIITAPLTLFN